MPIKFRCSYCRQFLGISRGRAGEVVDCPTCGRTIRVPGLDGSVAPVPDPAINTADTHLARALDELAALAQIAAPKPVRMATATESVGEPEAEAEIPQPLPEPEPVELPLPEQIRPIPVDAVTPSAPGSSLPQSPQPGTHPNGSGSAAGPAARTGSGDDNLQQLGQALAELIAQVPATSEIRDTGIDPAINQPRIGSSPSSGVNGSPAARSDLRRTAGGSTGLLARLLPAATLLLGLAIGWWARSELKPSDPRSAVDREQQLGDDAPAKRTNDRRDGSGQPATKTGAAASIRGRITYSKPTGERAADSAALVMLFPQEWTGASRLSPAGWHMTDPPGDVAVLMAQLQAMGGQGGITTETGDYTLTATSPGTYRLLVVSRWQTRANNDPLEPTLVAELRRYLADPSAAIGARAATLATVQLEAASMVWDHIFEP